MVAFPGTAGNSTKGCNRSRIGWLVLPTNRFSLAQIRRLLWRSLLIWAESDRSKDKILGHDLWAQGLQSTAPAKVIGQVLRRDAMEGTQPFLEAAVVGIDVVDVEIGCLRVGLAGHWQDVSWDASPAGEGNVNAGEKMHRRAGVKMQQGRTPEGPRGGLPAFRLSIGVEN